MEGERIDFEYNGWTYISPGTAPSAGDPDNYKDIGLFWDLTGTIANWVYLNMTYDDSDVVNESSLALYKYNDSWHGASNFSTTSGADTTNNYVYANITGFSTFAPKKNSFIVKSIRCGTELLK